MNSCAVARMRLSAIGRACSILNFEAAIASGTVKATTVPFCIAAAACNASFSPDSRRTTLKTSYIVTVGTTSEAESSRESGNALHLAHQRSMQANRKNLQYSYSIFLSFEFCIDALEESTEFFDIAFRYKLDTSGIFYNLHFLTRTQHSMPPLLFLV